MRTATPLPSTSSPCRPFALPANKIHHRDTCPPYLRGEFAVAPLRSPRRVRGERKMDFGLRGKTALVCAASKGLGRGCAMALAGEGVDLVITARGKDALEATAAEIRAASGVKVTAVVGDITTPEGRAAALKSA